MWYYFAVALGRTPPAEFICLFEDRRATAGRAPTAGQAPKNSTTGVQHKTCQAKRMREDAKLKQKQWTRMRDKYDRGEWVDIYSDMGWEVEARSTRQIEKGETIVGDLGLAPSPRLLAGHWSRSSSPSRCRRALKSTPSLALPGAVLQDLWARAIAASDAAGHPYIGRDGRQVVPKPPGKFESALRRYCSEVLHIPFPE